MLGLRDLDSGEEADTEAADAKIQAASAQRACTKLSLSNANYKAAAASSNFQVKETTTRLSAAVRRAEPASARASDAMGTVGTLSQKLVEVQNVLNQTVERVSMFGETKVADLLQEVKGG